MILFKRRKVRDDVDFVFNDLKVYEIIIYKIAVIIMSNYMSNWGGVVK